MNSPNTTPKRGPHRRNYMKGQGGLKLDPDVINDKPVLKNVERCTEKDYARQLENWDDL